MLWEAPLSFLPSSFPSFLPANDTDCAGHREYSDEQDRTKSLPSWGFYSHQGEVNRQRSQYVKQEFLTAVHAMKNVEQAEMISIVL